MLHRQAEIVASLQRAPLAVHFPPVELTSFHAPGQCALIVFTRPGHVMRWLPEQTEEEKRVVTKDQRVCAACGEDISNRRVDAMYRSVRCQGRARVAAK